MPVQCFILMVKTPEYLSKRLGSALLADHDTVAQTPNLVQGKINLALGAVGLLD